MSTSVGRYLFVATLLCFALLTMPSRAQQVVVVGELTRLHLGDAGSTIAGRITVNNRGREARNVRAYLTDYQQSRSGGSYPPASTLARSSAEWMTITPGEQRIDPGASGIFAYEMHIPATDLPIGTFWNVIMIEGSDQSQAAPPDAADQPAVPAFSITPRFRTAVRVDTQVGPVDTDGIAFINRHVVDTGAGIELEVLLANTGNSRLPVKLWLEQFGSDQSNNRLGEPQEVLIYPGGERRVRLPLASSIKNGEETLIVADVGGTMLGALYKLQLP